VSIDDLPGVSVVPPRTFVGSMDLNVELRLNDNSVADRKSLQVEWLGRGMAPRLQARQHDAVEIAQMVKKGAELMAVRDVASARLMVQGGAEGGEAAAGFALAESYDPLVLAKGGDSTRRRAGPDMVRKGEGTGVRPGAGSPGAADPVGWP